MPEMNWGMANNTTTETADTDATVKILALPYRATVEIESQ